MDIALFTIRIFLFVIFSLAAVGKAFDLGGTEKAIEEFGVPSQLSFVAARLLPLAEILVALMFLHTSTSWLGAIAAGVLLSAFTAGMLWQILTSSSADCHCFGQLHSEPVSGKSVARNVVLLALSVVLVTAGSSGQGINIFRGDQDGTQSVIIILGFASAILMLSVLILLKQVFEHQSEVIERLEVLELTIDGGSVVREGLEDPSSGLPIGVPVPLFEVRNLVGDPIGSQDLFRSDKPSLLIMVSPTCSPCEALLPEIHAWKNELSEKLDFVLLSTGARDENAEKFPEEDPEKFVLQEDKEVSEKLGTKWTPTAILIGRDHLIASRPAAGDGAIRDLVDQIREVDLDKDELAVYAANGSKIGRKVPDFKVEDMKGHTITASHFQNTDTIVACWSTTCPHCADMIDDLREWDRHRRSNDLKLMLIAIDNGEETLDLGLVSPVVLDNKTRLLARQFGLPGPPSAVRVNREGKIVSEAAIGAEQIWKLIGDR